MTNWDMIEMNYDMERELNDEIRNLKSLQSNWYGGSLPLDYAKTYGYITHSDYNYIIKEIARHLNIYDEKICAHDIRIYRIGSHRTAFYLSDNYEDTLYYDMYYGNRIFRLNTSRENDGHKDLYQK